MGIRLGVDIGGTFTDFLLLDEERGKTYVAKVSSTPEDPSQAIVLGIERVCARAGVAPGAVKHIVHGTTVATNTVLEGRGARVGLVTTEGFREILHLGRGETPGPLAGWITMIKPDPLADVEDTFEAAERLASSGAVIVPLDSEHLREGLGRLYDRGIESLTVSFLHSYANQGHEQRAAEIARELDPAVPVTLASDVVSEFREYERTQTAVINAYIKPRLRGYLRDLEERLAAQGLRADVTLLRSDGGMMSLADAAERPVNALLSGPAGGVAGAVWTARTAGFERILSFDMGGTSTDCCLSLGSPSVSWETKVGPFPVKIPSVEIATVGAGVSAPAARAPCPDLLATGAEVPRLLSRMRTSCSAICHRDCWTENSNSTWKLHAKRSVASEMQPASISTLQLAGSFSS
jgi:N-methylhydantoinase A